MDKNRCMGCAELGDELRRAQSSLEASQKFCKKGAEVIKGLESALDASEKKLERTERLLKEVVIDEHKASQRIAELESPWISVEDRLPESPGDYLVYNAKVRFGRERTGAAFWYMGDVRPIWDSCSLGCPPSHWQPLPKEPSQ